MCPSWVSTHARIIPSLIRILGACPGSESMVGNLAFHTGCRCPGAAEQLPVQPHRRRARPKQEAWGAAGARSGGSVPSPPSPQAARQALPAGVLHSSLQRTVMPAAPAGAHLSVSESKSSICATWCHAGGPGRRAPRRVVQVHKVVPCLKAPEQGRVLPLDATPGVVTPPSACR